MADNIESLLGIDVNDPSNRLAAELTENVYAMLDAMVAKRHELGLSRAYIARQIGVNEEAISRLENFGDGNLFLLKCYAFALGMTISFKAENYENI